MIPTERTSLLEIDGASLWYYPASQIVHHELRRFVYGEELHKILDCGYEALRANKAKKWLSDDRGNAPLRRSDETWARTDWFPRVRAAGWKWWAVVMPEKVLGQMNMTRWIELYADLGVTARSFEDPVAAYDWLAAL